MDSTQGYTSGEESAMPVEEGASGSEEAEGKTCTPFVSRIEYERLQKEHNATVEQLRKVNEDIQTLQEQLEKLKNEYSSLTNDNMQLKFKEIQLKTEIRMLRQFREERKQEMSALNDKMTMMEQILKEDRKWKEAYEERELKWKKDLKQEIQMLSDKIPGKFKPNKVVSKQINVINLEATSSKYKNCVKKEMNHSKYEKPRQQ